MSSPLAIADASTISQKDLIETDQIFPDRIGEIYHLAYEKKQKWYWVSEMRNYEALIFKLSLIHISEPTRLLSIGVGGGWV